MSSFVRDEGDGEPIVMMHGWSSSYLHRKIIGQLAVGEFRAMWFDLAGRLRSSENRDRFDLAGLRTHPA